MSFEIPEVFREFADSWPGKEIAESQEKKESDAAEIRMLIPEVSCNFPGFEGQEVVVFGDPIKTGNQLDSLQGDNPFLARGNCGLVTTANILNLCGFPDATETAITKYAIDNNLCLHGWFISPMDRGATTNGNQTDLLSCFGIESQIFTASAKEGSLESIASRLEAGYVGGMNLNAGYLWNEAEYVRDGCANHAVALTGTVRDAKTGELLGLTICDSGGGNACDVVTMDELTQCYLHCPNASVWFTSLPLREENRV